MGGGGGGQGVRKFWIICFQQAFFGSYCRICCINRCRTLRQKLSMGLLGFNFGLGDSLRLCFKHYRFFLTFTDAPFEILHHFSLEYSLGPKATSGVCHQLT